MDKATARAIKRMDKIATLIEALPEIGAQEYANGRLRAKPIVNRHFTAGNQGRYGWMPLSRAYFLDKSRGIVTRGGAAHHLSAGERGQISALQKQHKAVLKGTHKDLRKAQRARHRADVGKLIDSLIGGREGSRLDKKAEFHTPFVGDIAGVGATTNLPMLVRSGRLKQAVNSRTHRIVRSGDTAVIVFGNLPVYALAHHRGGAHLPKRSPVEPNAEDREEVVKVMQRQLDVAIGTGGDVAVEARSIPGRARVG